MAGSTTGRIAQLLYTDARPLDFLQVVEDMRQTLSQMDDAELSTGWDGSNVAFFELAAVRIVLAAKDHPRDGWSTCLTLAVELSATGSEPEVDAGCEDTCASVVEHVQRRYPAATIRWTQSDAPLTQHLHECLIQALPAMALCQNRPPLEDLCDLEVCDPVSLEGVSQAEDAAVPAVEYHGNALPLRRSLPQSRAAFPVAHGIKDAIKIARKSLSKSAGAGSRARVAKARARGRLHFTTPASTMIPNPELISEPPSLPDTFDMEFARLREAFNEEEIEIPAPRLSTPLRLTTHALNASLIVVLPPLGAAMMAYSLLKGEDARLSGQMVVLTGLFGAAFNTPLGQHMAALFGA